ncbi:transposase family protein [Rhodococcus koreensis]|uniref:transposase family protein n=1 Tax=Rhodococcus koreensis TaxID=99653 RepID=UPI00366E144D
MQGATDANEEFHSAVVAALLAGGSVREVARITGLSPNTVERWGHAGGWPERGQRKSSS